MYRTIRRRNDQERTKSICPITMLSLFFRLNQCRSLMSFKLISILMIVTRSPHFVIMWFGFSPWSFSYQMNFGNLWKQWPAIWKASTSSAWRAADLCKGWFRFCKLTELYMYICRKYVKRWGKRDEQLILKLQMKSWRRRFLLVVVVENSTRKTFEGGFMTR